MWPKAEDIMIKCGPYQVAAVLRECGITPPAIDELYAGEFYRRRDWMLPWHPGLILRRYGVASRWRYVSRGGFVGYLKRRVEEGVPVLFVIHSIWGLGGLHWISSRGYSEARGGFLCYDSQRDTTHEGVGNVAYTPEKLTERLPWFGTFAIEIR